MKNIYSNTPGHFLHTNPLHIVLIVFFILLSFPVKGQINQKKQLSEKDYLLWHYLEAEEISDNGNWISYKKSYDTVDSLFVQHRKTGKIHFIAGGAKGQFASDHYFVCSTPDNTLHLLSLDNGQEKLLKNITSFEIHGRYLIGISREKESYSLSVYNLEGKMIFSRKNVVDHALSSDNKKIALSIKEDQKNLVRIATIDTAKEPLEILEVLEGSVQKLTWSADDSVLAFMDYGAMKSKLYYYQLDKKAMSSFSTADKTVFPETMNLDPQRKFNISPDNKRVFFRMRQRRELDIVHPKNEIQIWNAADKFIYPKAKEIENWNIINKHAYWEPATGRFLQFTDTKLPQGGEVQTMNYALTFNPQDYEPQNNSYGKRDIYITDLNTGERKLLLKKLSTSTANLLASPGGKYISYFREGNWYVYDINKGTHKQINQNIPYPLNIADALDQEDGYSNPGWTSDEQYLLLHDQYDVWKVSPDGSTAVRLTKGREKGIVYRIVPQNITQKTNHDIWIYTSGLFDLKDGLVLQARSIDHFFNGIFTWDLKKGVSEVCYTDKRISTFMRSKNNVFAWTEEDTDLPWQIKAKEPGSKETIVMRSNTQQEQFLWTKREMVTYQSRKGETLKGILYYPAAYQKGQRYPMVVNVYEKQSYQVHYYHVPTLYNGDGFNVGHLTPKGYFVLLPDITYEVGNVGLSAVDCVEAAVKAVLKNHDVDEKKIGLIGHSFGGFESDFIITQSKLFACAVAGAATTNYLSSYLAVSSTLDIPNFYKMEYGQARMKVSPYENMDWYLKNSPVMHAPNVSTPLLSWTGLQDPQVLPTQSFEFYMALRRLGKTHIMLAYPDEGHELIVKENAIDLTRRIEGWFDYYLQGAQAPSWSK